jgi:branched-chain amino acid transport system substrate-binding protein
LDLWNKKKEGKMEKKVFGSVIVSCFVCMLLIATGSDVCFAKEESKKAIEIGMTTDMSGPTANNGLMEAKTAEMAVAAINAAGGIKGRPINFRFTDNGADPTKIVGQLKMFKDRDKCVAAITGTTTTVTMAAKAWAEQNRIPIIAPDAMSDVLDVPKVKSWVFRTNAANSVVIGAALLKIKGLGHKKVGLISTTQTWGTDALATMKAVAPNYGLQFVGAELLEVQSKDATIQVRKLRNSGAEALVQLDYAAEIGVWARALQQVDWHPYVVSYDAEITMSLKMYPAELFEGWGVVGMMDPTKPLMRKVWDDYEKYSGKKSDTVQIGRAYDAANVLLEAIKISENPDKSESIRDAFYKVQTPLVLGRKGSMGGFEIGRNYTLKPEDMVIFTVRSGKFVAD